MRLSEWDTKEIIAGFLELERHYTGRNDFLQALQEFFEGDQWDSEEERAQEEFRLVLNYTKATVLRHTSYLVGKPPKVDVPQSPSEQDPSLTRRERLLRTIVRWPKFRGTYRRVEMCANKFGFGLLLVQWTGKAEGGKFTSLPYTFRQLNPQRFYPRLKSDNETFLYAYYLHKDRLVEELREEYGTDLIPAKWAVGGVCDVVEFWTDSRYVVIALTGQLDEDGERMEEPPPITLEDRAHKEGRVPIFLLPNILDPDRDPTDGGSISEVDTIESLNRHLNLIVSLTAEEIATRIHPPLVYKSDDHSQPPGEIKAGAGEVIPLRLDEEIEPLDWTGIPTTVQEHRNAIMASLRDLAALPRTSFGEATGAMTGVGMRLSYASLEQILSLKVPAREDFLSEVLEFCLFLAFIHLKDAAIDFWTGRLGQESRQVTLTKEDLKGYLSCEVSFVNLIPRDKVQHEQHIAYLFNIEMITHRTALEQIDWIPDPLEELRRFEEEREAREPKEQPALRSDAAPPVPASPELPTRRNTPYLRRAQGGNFPQAHPGVNPGPPIEVQP